MGEEKRLYPRIKTKLRIETPKSNFEDLIDISENGLGFSSTETISSPSIPLQICFTDSKFKFHANAKLIWKRDIESGNSIYGCEFIRISDATKIKLRKQLIQTQVKEFLTGIKDTTTRKEISHFFLKDILSYTNKINKLIKKVPKLNKFSETLQKQLTHLNTQTLLKGYRLEKMIENKLIISNIKKNFRSLVGTWAYKGPIMKRGFDKPRGYPGDYLMLETIYDNQPLGKNIGLYFDKYFLNNPYAVAVRYRKDKLREILADKIKENQSEIIRIYNIACGSCREIRELPRDTFYKKNVIFTCVDWDEEALEFSRKTTINLPSEVKFNFIKQDIIEIIKNKEYADSIEKQNIVYSIGLIDYIPDRILKIFMRFFFDILQKNGTLLLTHKNKEKTFSPIPPDWFCEWKFVPRTKDDVINLFYDCGIQNFSISTAVDQFNDIFYFTLTKN